VNRGIRHHIVVKLSLYMEQQQFFPPLKTEIIFDFQGTFYMSNLRGTDEAHGLNHACLNINVTNFRHNNLSYLLDY
jgi:hypothetical protein